MASIASFGQTENINKNIPENTLSIIQSEGRTIYLTNIRQHVRKALYPKNSWYGKAREQNFNGNFLLFSFIEGNYPADYTQQGYFLFIPEDKISELKIWLNYYDVCKNGELITKHVPSEEWENVGYLTDDTLWAKIVEYYLNNKDTSQ